MAPGLILDRIIGIFKGYTNVAAIAMIGARAVLLRNFPGPRDAGRRSVAGGIRLRTDAAAHLRQDRHHRSATRSDAGTVVRHGGQLPGHHALPLPHRHLHRLTALHGDRVPFLLNGMLTAGLALLAFRRRDDFTLGLDASYYKR